MKNFLTAMLLCFATVIIADQPDNGSVILQNETDFLLVGRQTYFLEDREGNLGIDDIVKPENQKRFQRNEKDVFIRRPSASAFWLKLSILNQNQKDAWIELGSIYLWYIDYYSEQNGKLILTTSTGSVRPEGNKAYPTNLFWLPIGKKNNLQTVYVRINTQRPLELPIHAGTTLSLSQNKARHDNVAAAFVGLMLAMFFYNLFLLFSTRDKIYIWYLLYILSAIPSTSYINNYPLFESVFGKKEESFWHLQPFTWLSFPYIFMGYFAIYFLSLNNRVLIKRLIQVFILIFVLFAITDFFVIAPHHILVAILQPVAFIYLLFFLGIGIYLWWFKNEKNARFFSLAWVFAILSVLDYLLTINGLLPYNYLNRNAAFFGIGMETLMFSLALGDRINILRDEHQSEQAKHLSIILEQKQELVHEVSERKKAFESMEELSSSLEQKVTTRTNLLTSALNRITDDVRLALKIQKNILPKKTEEWDGIEIYSRYMPMTDVGGDYYAINKLENGTIRIFIADATGHGIQASLMTMCIHAEYFNVKDYPITPGHLLTILNNQYCDRYSRMNAFFTCIILDIEIHEDRITYASAGHPDQILVQSGKITPTHVKSRLMGLQPEYEYKDFTAPFFSGDKILLFTDGIFEEFNSNNEEFGEERLFRIVDSEKNLSGKELFRKIMDTVSEFISGTDQNDDITFLVIERK
ncbi:MAG: SpoIIE family protein phosphatase [Leptospira sp.]|nr:SpoIIE family protein phosphatase [Leptospira sp.]